MENTMTIKGKLFTAALFMCLLVVLGFILTFTSLANAQSSSDAVSYNPYANFTSSNPRKVLVNQPLTYTVNVVAEGGIADVNEEKWGRFTPGTNIPIISEEMAKSLEPDYFLVLPWHFRDNIIEREKEYLNGGGCLIFPLPKIEIIGG